ncbi:MAG TPA: carboxypeptidase regulatory-like domain-containing protein [Verrucomicrobiales bacterium]|nr:carboxypeptidase regulatory-like domain-containing protein [Verrucomicrobiales bacterium]
MGRLCNEYYYGITDPIRLTSEEPLPNIDIRIGEGIPIRGKVLFPEGTPAVEVPIHLSYLPPISHSFGAIDIYTDSEGLFDFPNVNPDASGKYSLSIRLEEDFQPYRIDIKHPWDEMNIKLETGLESRGRILDARTGKPVTGAKITAHDFQYHYMSETTTDADGVFHFTTLGNSEYRLFASQLNWASREDPRITGGQSAVATFKVNIPEWSKHFSAIEGCRG